MSDAPKPTTGAAGGAEVPDLLANLQRSITRDREDRERAAAAVPSPEAAPTADVVLEAKRDALREARQVITQYLSTAELWRYDRVCWAFAVMLGEVLEDTPEPPSPSDPNHLEVYGRAAADRAKVARVEALLAKYDAHAERLCPEDDWNCDGDAATTVQADTIRSVVDHLRRALDGEGT